MPAWRRPATAVATFAVGGSGGLLFELAGVPLPWLLGAIVAVGAGGLAGARLQVPARSRQLGQLVAGVAVGLYFTPTVAAQLLGIAPAMVLAASVSVAAAVVLSRLLANALAVDRATAYFGGLPGGVAEMSVLADRHGGDAALVGLAQSLRIVCVVLTVPPLITLSGMTGTVDYSPVGLPVQLPSLAGMFAVAAVLAVILARLDVTNAWLLAGLAVGVVTGVAELPLSSVPRPLFDAGQLLIGSALGARFRRETRAHLRRFVPVSVGLTLALMLVNAAMAAALVPATGLHLATLVLATAPGGVAEMSITAKALQLGVPAVTAFHLTRTLFVVLFSDALFRLVRPLLARSRPSEGD